MFERYTEAARRTIFFARYEASMFGSPYIEPEHLLLGLLREDRAFRGGLPAGAAEQIRKRIEERVPQPVERSATSVDLPLSQDSRKALAYAAEESQALQHDHIDCGHLLLGILRLDTSAAADVLRELGIEYASYREVVAKPAASPSAPSSAAALEAILAALPVSTFGGPLGKAAADLDLLLKAVNKLDENGKQRLKRARWTRKEALGHLIDWAAAHQQWFARALSQPQGAAPQVTGAGYPEDTWLASQHYNEMPWFRLVDLCVSLNRLIIHVIAHIPEDKLDTPCRIGIAEPIPLQELVRRYVAHCEDVVAQLLTRR
jgi:Clp amino terminal domain, pathogenicity island component